MRKPEDCIRNVAPPEKKDKAGSFKLKFLFSTPIPPSPHALDVIKLPDVELDPQNVCEEKRRSQGIAKRDGDRVVTKDDRDEGDQQEGRRDDRVDKRSPC